MLRVRSLSIVTHQMEVAHLSDKEGFTSKSKSQKLNLGM
jgi:hypothetical protein